MVAEESDKKGFLIFRSPFLILFFEKEIKMKAIYDLFATSSNANDVAK